AVVGVLVAGAADDDAWPGSRARAVAAEADFDSPNVDASALRRDAYHRIPPAAPTPSKIGRALSLMSVQLPMRGFTATAQQQDRSERTAADQERNREATEQPAYALVDNAAGAVDNTGRAIANARRDRGRERLGATGR